MTSHDMGRIKINFMLKNFKKKKTKKRLQKYQNNERNIIKQKLKRRKDFK